MGTDRDKAAHNQSTETGEKVSKITERAKFLLQNINENIDVYLLS